MPYTKEDVASFRCVGGEQVELTDAERQAMADEWNANEAAAEAGKQYAARCAQIDEVIAADTVVAQLKAMNAEELDAWWAANVTNAAQAIAVLKRIVRVVIRRLL